MKKILIIKNTQAGFSLVEILVSLFIVVIIGMAIVSFQINLFSLNRISNDNLLAQEDARRALKNMSTEIRSMSPSSMGAYAIVQAATSSLTFYTNIDSDSLQEKVRYFLDGKTFKRGVVEPSGSPLNYNGTETTRELIHDIANATTSIFSYYNSSYDGTSAPLTQPVDTLLIRLIKINVIIDKDPLKLPPPLFMTTQVSIRNLKDNL